LSVKDTFAEREALLRAVRTLLEDGKVPVGSRRCPTLADGRIPSLGQDDAWREPVTLFVSLRHFSRTPRDEAVGFGVSSKEKSLQFEIMILITVDILDLSQILSP
jgi:hypothetical protein